jgi:hypothetical protein
VVNSSLPLLQVNVNARLTVVVRNVVMVPLGGNAPAADLRYALRRKSHPANIDSSLIMILLRTRNRRTMKDNKCAQCFLPCPEPVERYWHRGKLVLCEACATDLDRYLNGTISGDEKRLLRDRRREHAGQTEEEMVEEGDDS